MGWEDSGTIIASLQRQKILRILVGRPSTPKELSRILDMHLSQVSRSLKQMERRNLVKCTTPNLRKGRFYIITARGKEALDNLVKRSSL
jgi:DNA-binding MarR family transcriptional regulator